MELYVFSEMRLNTYSPELPLVLHLKNSSIFAGDDPMKLVSSDILGEDSSVSVSSPSVWRMHPLVMMSSMCINGQALSRMRSTRP